MIFQQRDLKTRERNAPEFVPVVLEVGPKGPKYFVFFSDPELGPEEKAMQVTVDSVIA